MSVKKQRRQNLQIAQRSVKAGSPVIRQLFKLACFGYWRQLQLYTFLIGVVDKFFHTG